MHIEPGVVDGAKMLLGYATSAVSIGLAGKMLRDTLVGGATVPAVLARTGVATAAVVTFFQVLPHYPAGVSEVHLILGSTLFLLLGAGPAAVGLAAGLLLQGLFFAQGDLPQLAMNLTTLLVPLWAISVLAKRVIPSKTRYADISYGQALALSTVYQGGIVGWVAFWATYGNGLTLENLASVSAFGAAYVVLAMFEPLVDIAVLALAKTFGNRSRPVLMQSRVLNAT